MGHDVRVMTYEQENADGKPNGDALFVSVLSGRQIYAVADGVSRFEKIDKGRSPHSAAEIFCQNVVEKLRSSGNLESAFQSANHGIQKLNREYGITADTVDWLDNDYVSCVGVVGQLFLDRHDGEFMYGLIGDCGVLVFNNERLTIEFVEDRRISHLEEARDNQVFKNIDERRVFWRKELRNKPEARHMTYGVLTGECEAVAYLMTGCIHVEKGDTIIVFSDGISPFLSHDTFRSVLQQLLRGVDIDTCKCQNFVRSVLDVLTRELKKQHTKKLNDDRTFIAISV